MTKEQRNDLQDFIDRESADLKCLFKDVYAQNFNRKTKEYQKYQEQLALLSGAIQAIKLAGIKCHFNGDIECWVVDEVDE